jgi:hypothetical protein
VEEQTFSQAVGIYHRVYNSRDKTHTDKKEKKIFLIYKGIQMGSGAKSYMRKGFLIYEEMHKCFHHI